MRPVDEKYKWYLYDLGYILKERALQAKEEKGATEENTLEREFQSGRVIAFNEVISIMQQQAKGFDIPLDDMRLNDIEPDRDLT